MRTFNLVYPDKSDIKYEIQRFPDGQQNIVIQRSNEHPVKTVFAHIKEVEIKSRLNNWLDLELIICAVASLRELGVKEIHLYTPYIMGARSDRKFKEGGNNYLRDVICPIINSLELDSVTCIDPHSDVLEACIKGFRKESNISLFKWAIMEMFPYKEMPKGYFDRNHFEQNTILVSPDAGASKKIYKLAEQIGYKGDIITCSKERDENGNLTKTVVTIHGNGKCNKDFIIIDDICDGGSTFINIAKEIKNYFNHEDFDGYQPKIYLIVTHGIFSKGLIELTEYFDSIYCANSYSDDKGWPRMHQNFKQLNVF